MPKQQHIFNYPYFLVIIADMSDVASIQIFDRLKYYFYYY